MTPALDTTTVRLAVNAVNGAISTAGPVVIVGVGALGSHVALCARNWDCPVRLVDHDAVEAKNVLAQMHGRGAIGQRKPHAVRQLLQLLFGTRVDAVPHKLVQDNASALLSDARLVIDCTDDAPTRDLIQGFCAAYGVRCLHSALAADGQMARIGWGDRFVVDRDAPVGVPTCVDGEHLPFIVMAAAQTAVVAQRFLRTGEQLNLWMTPTGTIRV